MKENPQANAIIAFTEQMETALTPSHVAQRLCYAFILYARRHRLGDEAIRFLLEGGLMDLK